MNKIRRIDLFFEKKNIDNSQPTERTFSAMKIIKTRLRNRMEDDFFANDLIVYIEKKLLKDSQLI